MQMRDLRTGKQAAPRLEFFHESLCRFHHSFVVYETWRGGEHLPACAAPSFKTNNPKPSQKTLPAPWNPTAIFAIDFCRSLNTLNNNKRKAVPHIKSSQRDTQLYIANSYGQTVTALLHHQLKSQYSGTGRTTNIYYPSKKDGII